MEWEKEGEHDEANKEMRKCLSEACDLPICAVHFYPM